MFGYNILKPKLVKMNNKGMSKNLIVEY